MVTASEGSPSLVTSRPLNRPAARPSSTRTAKMASIGQCLAHRNPSSALDMPRMDATDRSISPLMMMSVIGSAMIATSPEVTPRLNRFEAVRKSGETAMPNAKIATTTSARPVSHRTALCIAVRSAPPRPCSGSGGLVIRLGSDTGTPSSQRGREPQRDDPVERDGRQQQGTGDRLVPERRDAEHVERRVDGLQQQRPDGRPTALPLPPK